MARPGSPDWPRHYVYRFYDGAGALLYIGCTWNLPTRLAGHRRRPWFKHIRRQTVTTYPNERAARDAERAAIHAERPLHNVTFNQEAAA